MSRSNLTDAVAAFDRCSDGELRQLSAMIAVRLGEALTSKTSRGHGKQVGGDVRGKTSKGKAQKPAGKTKGNPQRKSQYANHPVYMTYRFTKQKLEKEVKESKTLFKDFTGPARDAYVKALSAWLQTKSGFRASKKEDENPDFESEEVSRDGGGGGRSDALVFTGQTKTQNGLEDDGSETNKKRRRSSDKSRYRDPPDSWKPVDGTEWKTLNRQMRKDAYKAADATPDKSEDQMEQEG
jgi:hypothetical protein